MTTRDQHKMISRAFDKIHEQLSILRDHVEGLGGPATLELMDNMEFATLAAMRKLRNHLGIPYDWHDGGKP